MGLSDTSLQMHADSIPGKGPVPPSLPRRRTLGTCAHCGDPVSIDQEYVRLYRRAWHLECALASGPSPVRAVPERKD